MKEGQVYISKVSKREVTIERLESEDFTTRVLVHYRDSIFGIVQQGHLEFQTMLEKGGFILRDQKPFFSTYNVFHDGRNGGRYIKVLTTSPRKNSDGDFMYFIESKWDDGRVTYSAVKESYLYAYANDLAVSHRGRGHG